VKQVNDIIREQFRTQIWKYAIIFFLICLTVGLELVTPFIYKILIDNVLGGKPLESSFPVEGILIQGKPLELEIPFLKEILSHFSTPESLGIFVVILFFATNIILSIINYIHSLIITVVIQKGIFEFSKTAFRNFESYSIGTFRRIDIGDYIYRLSYDVYALGDLLEDGIIPIITSSLFLIASTIIMYFMSAKLMLISFITIPFLVVTLYYFNKKVGRASKHSELSNSTVFSFMQQSISQLKIIQAYSQEQTMANDFNHKKQDSLKAQLRLLKVNFLYDLIVGLAIAITYTTIFSYGIKAVFAGEITTGLLIVFIYFLDNLTNPMISIADALYDIKQSRVRISRLSDFFDEKSHLQDTGTIMEMRDTSIEFEHVTLRGEEDFEILKDVSCKIPANKITIIAGISGSGKTSFISLIPRLIEKPTEGRVMLGKIDITQYSAKTLRENIAFVAQENSLFNHSIRNVISFGKQDATFEEIHKAAKLACADEFILEHPEGYNFKVGEGGNYLSGGQRQRLMIARAFIKDAPIMVLDEPFSNLDENTKKRVWENIKEYSKERTIVIVSNILDFISQADYIILINNGVLRYEGEYRDLRSKHNLANLLLESF
jgi:subfamily B ATP-binding cassette protein MsbA